MAGVAVLERASLPFEIAPMRIERRLTGRAIDAWQARGGEAVTAFDASSVYIVDPAGRPMVLRAGAAVARMFGLRTGMTLDAPGLAAEARAACDLIALRPEPVCFETMTAAVGRGCVLVRAVALPLGRDVEQVQIVIGWREVLGRSATARLRRELGGALRLVTDLPATDPFL